MQSLTIIAAILLLAAISFWFGRARSVRLAGGQARALHSLPSYHGWYLALFAALPAFAVLALWLAIQPFIIRWIVVGSLPPEIRDLSGGQLSLVINNIFNIARGEALGAGAGPHLRLAADRVVAMEHTGSLLMMAVIALAAIVGFVLGRRRIATTFRARNRVEQAIKIVLIASSTLAILTTVGIVMSMLFESIKFFSIVPPQEFFFGTVWDPRFTAIGREGGAAGQFGLIPVLWGTIFISIIAMLVAVPIGLMSAIYLAEYANRRVRAVVKPLLEILAGIPTVVYGFFALLVVGPLFRDLGNAFGISISANSALTAGVVMGIMIIPFVSSLSDDMLTAVPRSLRDGSYGLGATKSETIKQVLLKAALPGIVGGVLLAVSRAVGETMIVVMAAGIAANLTINPFEAVTTVTVKIVSQLTGDLEFNSPQTLVAFALGLTLFVITLGLNILALHIVRKYREQYE